MTNTQLAQTDVTNVISYGYQKDRLILEKLRTTGIKSEGGESAQRIKIWYYRNLCEQLLGVIPNTLSGSVIELWPISLSKP